MTFLWWIFLVVGAWTVTDCLCRLWRFVRVKLVYRRTYRRYRENFLLQRFWAGYKEKLSKTLQPPPQVEAFRAELAEAQADLEQQTFDAWAGEVLENFEKSERIARRTLAIKRACCEHGLETQRREEPGNHAKFVVWDALRDLGMTAIDEDEDEDEDEDDNIITYDTNTPIE